MSGWLSKFNSRCWLPLRHAVMKLAIFCGPSVGNALALTKERAASRSICATTSTAPASGVTQAPRPYFSISIAVSEFLGPMNNTGLCVAAIPYNLLGTTIPSQPRFIVTTCTAAAYNRSAVSSAGW